MNIAQDSQETETTNGHNVVLHADENGQWRQCSTPHTRRLLGEVAQDSQWAETVNGHHVVLPVNKTANRCDARYPIDETQQWTWRSTPRG